MFAAHHLNSPLLMSSARSRIFLVQKILSVFYSRATISLKFWLYLIRNWIFSLNMSLECRIIFVFTLFSTIQKLLWPFLKIGWFVNKNLNLEKAEFVSKQTFELPESKNRRRQQTERLRESSKKKLRFQTKTKHKIKFKFRLLW